MCCRISNKGFATRTIAGLYIFLATFLIGFFAVQAFSFIKLYNVSKVDKEPVKEVKEFNACDNQDGITVIKWYDNLDKPAHFSKPKFAISNTGKHPIYFFDADLRIYVSPDMEGASASNFGRKISDKENVLKPDNTTGFELPTGESDDAFTLKFWYRVGESQAWHSIQAHFQKGQRQSPERCICY